MNKIILSICLLFSVTIVAGQKINYQPDFDKALDKASAEKKLVLVIITAPIPKFMTPPGSSTPIPFNYKSGLDEKDVIDFYNKNFVACTSLYSDSLATPLRKKYSLTTYPAYLFIDSHNNLVYQDKGNSSTAEKYMDMGKKALGIVASGKTVSNAQAGYLLGNKTLEQLKEYINLNESAGIFDNAKLIDEYVDLLTIKSFQDYDEVLFVLQAGPYAYGKAYNLCFTNRKIADSIYKTEPVAVRSAINQRIIANTYHEAVKRKDAAMAQQAASFLAGTWRASNPRQGTIASQSQMLNYYSTVKDTALYFRLASNFYDSYYMNISADSAKKKTALSLNQLRKTVLENLPVETTITPNQTRTTMSITAAGSVTTTGNLTNGTALTLNNAAYQFYTLGTHNQNYLIKALFWSRRAIALDPKAGYYDTLAHLLYRMDFFDEALSAQNKAVTIATNNGTDKTELETLKAELIKIKKHTL